MFEIIDFFIKIPLVVVNLCNLRFLVVFLFIYENDNNNENDNNTDYSNDNEDVPTLHLMEN